MIEWYPECPSSGTVWVEKLQSLLDRKAAQGGFTDWWLEVSLHSDDALLALNREHLGHNYYTDIITFDLSVAPEQLAGSLNISIDRIKENAALYSQSPEHELCRVVVHGFLHLLGHGDASPDEKRRMRWLEDDYLAQVFHV
jgi:rRNA maturation RNase YbeY